MVLKPWTVFSFLGKLGGNTIELLVPMSLSFASSNLALVSNYSKVPSTPATLTLISCLNYYWCSYITRVNTTHGI